MDFRGKVKANFEFWGVGVRFQAVISYAVLKTYNPPTLLYETFTILFDWSQYQLQQLHAHVERTYRPLQHFFNPANIYPQKLVIHFRPRDNTSSE